MTYYSYQRRRLELAAWSVMPVETGIHARKWTLAWISACAEMTWRGRFGMDLPVPAMLLGRTQATTFPDRQPALESG